MEDSPRPKVRALLEGGALRVGLGCGGDGGVGPTLVSYLCGVRAGATGTVVAAMATAAVVAGAATTATAGGWRCSNGCGSCIRAGVGPASRGRRRVAHSQPEVVPSACLNHVWAGEGKEMKNGEGRGVK